MRVLTVLAGVVALALCACSNPARHAADPKGATPIRFATDWRAEAEQGGYYEALASGEYARRGLAVTIVPGGPGVNVPQLVAAGAVEMGIGSNAMIVMNLAAEHVPVRAVAAFMQKDPQVLIAHPKTGIRTLADLKGHPILLSDASITGLWVWLKNKYGLVDGQVRKYTSSSAPFLADSKVVQQGYLTSEPYTIEKQGGFKPVVMLLADDGYPGYASLVLAGDPFIAQHPDAVRAFVEASRAGWNAYLHGDAGPGDALILKGNPEMTEDVLAQARDKMRAAAIVGPEIGAMTDARWAAFFKMASDQHLVPANVDYKAAYTLAFLPKAL